MSSLVKKLEMSLLIADFPEAFFAVRFLDLDYRPLARNARRDNLTRMIPAWCVIVRLALEWRQ